MPTFRVERTIQVGQAVLIEAESAAEALAKVAGCYYHKGMDPEDLQVVSTADEHDIVEDLTDWGVFPDGQTEELAYADKYYQSWQDLIDGKEKP